MEGVSSISALSYNSQCTGKAITLLFLFFVLLSVHSCYNGRETETATCFTDNTTLTVTING